MARLAWVTGAGGLIGSQLVLAARRYSPAWTIRGLRRADLDLCDRDAVHRLFQRDRPDLLIHCAAQSRSPACQANPAQAHATNVLATERLADLADRARLVFFSTDLVFDGRTGNYDEEAPVHPLSVYAETKVKAERLVLAHPRHTVIRTSLNGGTSPTGDRGFNEQLRLAWQRGEKTKLFTDEFRSPIDASQTARAVWELVEQEVSGLFHLAGAQKLSRWDMGRLVAARWPQLHPQLEPGSLRDFPGPPRAPDTSLNCGRVSSLLSFPLPSFTEWIESLPAAQF